MKKLVSFLFAFVFIMAGTLCAQSLSIDTEYRLRGLGYSNADFLESTIDHSNYYSHRLRIGISGSPNENLKIFTKLQAIGIAEGTTAVSRYPDANFKPFIENIYFTYNQCADLPLNVSVGKQPFFYGQGLLVSDDELGFTGVKADYLLPWKDIKIDAFTFKSAENMGGNTDHDMYGLVNTFPGPVNTWQIGVFYDNNKTSGTLVNNDLVSSDKKIFYDIFLDGKLEGAYYKGELVMQKGSVNKVDPTLPDPTYNSISYLFEGGYYAFNPNFGRIEVKFTYGEGSGDDAGTTDKIEAFSPSFGHKFDGLERIGYGEFFAATLYDVFQGLNPGYSGLQVIGLGGNVAPFTKIKFDINYFLFKAKTAPSGASKNLGSELDLLSKYIVSKFLDLTGSVALFFPGDGTRVVGSRATRLRLESNIRF